jgi:hypothetical protein
MCLRPQLHLRQTGTILLTKTVIIDTPGAITVIVKNRLPILLTIIVKL